MKKNNKKICFIATTSLTLKIFVLETAKMLHKKMDVDVTFICNKDDGLIDILPDYIKYIPVPMKRGIDFLAINTIHQLVKVFKNEKFDIVQYSTPNASLYASIAAKIARVPIRLYAQWGIRYVGFQGIKRLLFKKLEKITCKNSTTIRAVSIMNLDFAVSEKLYPKSKAKVLGIGGTIGVNLLEYSLEGKMEWKTDIRKRLGCEEHFVFGFAGRLSKDKGGNELLAATRKIVESNPKTALLIVGPDEAGDEINSDLMDWVKKSNNVYFTGLVPKEQMPMYYAAIDVLVHPTYREGFGMVIQEAAAMRVPIITTRIPGASEVMEEGISCVLAKPKDTNTLYDCMMDLLKNSEKSKIMGDNARKRVEKYFDRNIMLNYQLLDYEKIGKGNNHE